jgi:hypothetical protein
MFRDRCPKIQVHQVMQSMPQATSRAKAKPQVFDGAQGEMCVFRDHHEKQGKGCYPEE